jgi:hypothetical protein
MNFSDTLNVFCAGMLTFIIMFLISMVFMHGISKVGNDVYDHVFHSKKSDTVKSLQKI